MVPLSVAMSEALNHSNAARMWMVLQYQASSTYSRRVTLNRQQEKVPSQSSWRSQASSKMENRAPLLMHFSAVSIVLVFFFFFNAASAFMVFFFFF